MRHEEFDSMLRIAWNSECQGNPVQKLCLKLKNLKNLLEFNQKNYDNIPRRVQQLHYCLKCVQKQLQSSPYNSQLLSIAGRGEEVN